MSTSPHLTAKDILEIRQRYAANPALRQGDLGAEYSISESTVGRIVQGETHKRLGGPRSWGKNHTPRPRLANCGRVTTNRNRLTISDAAVLAMREVYAAADGPTQPELCRMYGLSRYTIGRILRGDTRADIGGPLSQHGKHPPYVAVDRCQRCGLLDHDDGLCELCRRELDGGGFVLYQRAADT